MSDYTPSREMRLAGEKAILTALNQCGISLRYAIAGPSELFDVASVLLKSDWAESIRAEGRAETLADQGKPQITEHTERAVLTVDRIAQSTGMTRAEVVETIDAIGRPQITVTEQMVEAGAYRYWLESERDAEGDYPNREWEPDEREQFVWATRIVLEAALGKGGE